MMAAKASVIVAGAGPVGMCLAIDLARRGVHSLVLEQLPHGTTPSVRCNHVSSRTMEFFRDFGIASEVRDAGLPHDHPNDVVFRTRATGPELARIPIPCRNERFSRTDVPDGWWPTPEPPHRINQIFFDPILLRRALADPRITIINDHRLESYTQDEDGVSVQAVSLASGETVSLEAKYLVGCDGGRSTVRRCMGAKLVGDAVIQRVQSTYFRSPDLLGMLTSERGWMTYLYNPQRAGNLIAIDGRETWLLHNYLLDDEPEFEAVDRDTCLRLLLGVGGQFEYEVLATEDWIGRRLVADRFRDRRVFIAGDAAHLWTPYAGYGMNAGIADAMNLSWLLAAQLGGWGGDRLLDAYASERQPITDQVSRFAMGHAHKAIAERTSVPPEIEDADEMGIAARAAVGKAAYDLHVQQFACAGLNFGYFYGDSPIILADSQEPPAYTMANYIPSTAPGCRVPHFWFLSGASLYDRMGLGFSLLRFDPLIEVEPILTAAADRGIPLELIDVPAQDRPEVYREALVLSRPDRHVAWRGNEAPRDPRSLMGTLTGWCPT